MSIRPSAVILGFALVTAATALSVSSISSFAIAAAPDTDDAKALAERIQESRKGVIEADAQKRKILGSLYGINQRMKKITKEKSHLTDELFQVQDNVKSIAKLIASLELQIDSQRQHLRHRLRAIYKISGEGYVGVLFSSSNVNDLDETLRFLKIVSDNDYRLIKGYQENVTAYKKQKNKLRGQIERLVGIEKNIKKQEGMLADEHKAKSRIVSQLDKERVTNLQRIKSLRSKSQALAKSDNVNWGELLKPSIFEQKGQLSLPVRGNIVQDFGLITDEKYKVRISHKGWRIAAARGSQVSSIFDGTVAFAEWMDGYGQTVIVDHGDHYYSVYSHIARVKAKTGDTLKRGQVFAEAGAGTRGRVDGMYFEIRHFSEPENPVNWIAKNVKDKKEVAASEFKEESLKQ